MEYVYGAMLLHSAGKKVNEANLKKVLTAGGVKAEPARIKALVASLEGVDIEEAIKTSAQAAPVAPSVAPAQEKKEEAKEVKEEKKKEDEKKSEEEAASGLASLFG